MPGTVIGDRYRIGEVLASGGMGIVYRALHLELGSEVAVKTMRRELVIDDDAYERFVREARNTAQLTTSHVAKVFDFGRSQGGHPYLVMELLHGEALSARVKRGRLSNEESVKYLIQACAGLADAHARGMVHRDLKPDNLFLSDTEESGSELKLLDFGIAKSLTPFSPSLTLAGGSVGSPSYMAPEQMHSRPDLDHRADIWALGAVAYETLAGRPAFDGNTLTEICAKVLTEAPRPLSELRDDVWPELEVIISHCLERQPEHRFQDVLQLSRALEAALEAHDPSRTLERVSEPLPVSARLPVSGPGVDCTAETVANLDVSRELAQISGFSPRRWPKRLALLAALGAVAAAVWLWWVGWDQAALYAGHKLPAEASEEPIRRAALAVSANRFVQASQPDPAPATPSPVIPRVSSPVKAKSVREIDRIDHEPTAADELAIADAAVAERARRARQILTAVPDSSPHDDE